MNYNHDIKKIIQKIKDQLIQMIKLILYLILQNVEYKYVYT